MNIKLLKELSKQAETECGLSEEKLAELIVQECLNQCYNRGLNDELYAGQLKAAEYIKEHFGIEK